jgi:DNA-binding CsgD family transcriptional regulator
MLASSEQPLLDLIYGAAVDPDLWEPAIAQFTDAIHGELGWISNLSIVDGTGGTTSDPMARIDSYWPRAYIAHFGAINPLQHVRDAAAYRRTWKPTILTDEDWIARDELLRSEFYNDFLKPQNVQSSMMLRLANHGSDYATLNIGRAPSRDRYTKQDMDTARQFHPHLVRAFKLGRKVAGLHRISGHMAAVLDISPHGLIVLDEDGVVRHANRAAEVLLAERDTFRVAAGRLGLANMIDDRKLQLLIGQARGRERRTGGTMPVATPTRSAPLSLTVAPIDNERFATILEGRAVLICLTDLDAGVSIPERRLSELFDLTGAEARVARALLEGLSPQEAAAQFGISRHTVHVQLARVFEKTGANSQSALVRLMMRLVGFRPQAGA